MSGTDIKAPPHAPAVLAELLRPPMTSEQRLEALRRVQLQAEQRVKLGTQLFKAAEARLTAYQDVLDQVKAEQTNLREQVNADVTRSLHTYDQWIGQIDESFTAALRSLERRLDAMEGQWNDSQSRIERMLSRSQAVLDQSKDMLAKAQDAAGRAVDAAELAVDAASRAAAFSTSQAPPPFTAPLAPSAVPLASESQASDVSPEPIDEPAPSRDPVYLHALQQLRDQ